MAKIHRLGYALLLLFFFFFLIIANYYGVNSVAPITKVNLQRLNVPQCRHLNLLQGKSIAQFLSFRRCDYQYR